MNDHDFDQLPWADEKKGAASMIWDLVAVIGIVISVLAMTGAIGG